MGGGGAMWNENWKLNWKAAVVEEEAHSQHSLVIAYINHIASVSILEYCQAHNSLFGESSVIVGQKKRDKSSPGSTKHIDTKLWLKPKWCIRVWCSCPCSCSLCVLNGVFVWIGNLSCQLKPPEMRMEIREHYHKLGCAAACRSPSHLDENNGRLGSSHPCREQSPGQCLDCKAVSPPIVSLWPWLKVVCRKLMLFVLYSGKQ